MERPPEGRWPSCFPFNENLPSAPGAGQGCWGVRSDPTVVREEGDREPVAWNRGGARGRCPGWLWRALLGKSPRGTPGGPWLTKLFLSALPAHFPSIIFTQQALFHAGISARCWGQTIEAEWFSGTLKSCPRSRVLRT